MIDPTSDVASPSPPSYEDVENQLEKPKEMIKILDPKDPAHPQMWPTAWKIWITFMLSFFNLIVTVTSSIFGSGQKMIAEEFDLNIEVTILGTSLFLVGYIFGFLTISPLSEHFGRKYPMLIGMVLSSIFTLMPALGKSPATIFLGRFFSGLFGVSPVAILGGIISDCWDPDYRGVAMACCIALVFSGPTFGTVLGGFIANSSLGWRWTMWVVMIAGLGSAGAGVILFPETYPPILLRRKMKQLEHRQLGSTEKVDLVSNLKEKEKFQIGAIIKKYLGRPLMLFATQPILVMLTTYQSFIYGVMFLFYQSFTISFGEDRGWTGGLISLPLVGIIIGVMIGTAGVFVYNATYFRHHCYTPKGEFIPESRLPLMIIGAALIPGGMFWFAWTSDPNVPWPSQVCSSLLIGCGMYLLFLQCFTYIVDCYTSVANSAMGVNGAMRSIFGAVFPLFARPMFHGLGVNWAMTLLGLLSLALVPVPILFWYFGARIRSWSSAKVS